MSGLLGTAAAVALAAVLFPVQAQSSPQQPQAAQLVQARQAEDPRYSQTEKPPLHARHWLAITGKPLSATAGALIFAEGGNAVDAAAAMLAVGCTMWDTLSCGGETQALIYNPHTKKVMARPRPTTTPRVTTFRRNTARSRR